MESPFPVNCEYLVFTVNQCRYGVPGSAIVSVSDMPVCTHLPHLPDNVRGVVSFRSGGIPLFDLRVCFAAQARILETEELINTMGLRKQDHINWLSKLKDEVYNQKPITVQTDPHKCAFGKWYDQFHSDNTNLAAYMRRFDTPHKEIHQVAIDAAKLIKNNQQTQAKELVQRTETGILVRLLELFDGLANHVRKYLLEYAIIMRVDDALFAVAVDDINFFSRLNRIEYPLPSGALTHASHLVQALGRYHDEGGQHEKDVLLLDMSLLQQQVA
ncbi:MAG: CZB domain-containing protein [Magnetococcales bacterium]|nr:CZB domain-containing protein [Magnetococcales bacterium]MBF0114996.1 CZB domain-containing protein [Magnetococcales bacterium]